PEASYGLVAIGITFLLRDLCSRRHGQSIVASFSHTIWLAIGGIILGIVGASYLLVIGVLRYFVLYFLINAPQHELTGGVPVLPLSWLNDPFFAYLAVSPVVATLLAFWYLAARALRRRL